MARYIDVDLEVSDYVTVWDCDCSEFGKQTVIAVDDLQYLPTAEVVPKSDVDRLEGELIVERTRRENAVDAYHDAKAEVDRLQAEIETLKDNNEHLAVLLEEAKQEVSREIFAEIESMLIRYTFDDDYISLGIIDEFSELKKKYTRKML